MLREPFSSLITAYPEGKTESGGLARTKFLERELYFC